MFKVLGYDADGFGWTLVSTHRREADALAAGREVRGKRLFQWVATVLVRVTVSTGETEIDVIECNAPNVAALLNVAGFREAATAKAVRS